MSHDPADSYFKSLSISYGLQGIKTNSFLSYVNLKKRSWHKPGKCHIINLLRIYQYATVNTRVYKEFQGYTDHRQQSGLQILAGNTSEFTKGEVL